MLGGHYIVHRHWEGMLGYIYIDLGIWRWSDEGEEEVNVAYREDNVEK